MDFSTKRFFRNPVTLLAAFFLLGWFGVQFWGVAEKAYALYGERKRLEAELASLQQKKVELETELSRFQSEAYVEREAKRRLNLKKSGEQVVIVVPKEKQEESAVLRQDFWWRIRSFLPFLGD